MSNKFSSINLFLSFYFVFLLIFSIYNLSTRFFFGLIKIQNSEFTKLQDRQKTLLNCAKLFISGYKIVFFFS
uniref:Uncharacterized protein n=1 Tax=Populus trichocarpa TaxID=3694 RepID=A0A2K2BM49_POPTR